MELLCPELNIILFLNSFNIEYKEKYSEVI